MNDKPTAGHASLASMPAAAAALIDEVAAEFTRH